MLRSWFLLLLSCAVVSSFCACTGSDKPQFEAGDPLDTSPNSDPFVGAGGGGGSLSFPQFIPEDAYTGSGNGLPDAQEGTNGVQDVAEAEDASPAYADARTMNRQRDPSASSGARQSIDRVGSGPQADSEGGKTEGRREDGGKTEVS